MGDENIRDTAVIPAVRPLQDDAKAVESARRRWSERPVRPLEPLLVVALLLTLVFGVARPLGVEVFEISSSSMTPTLAPGDHVLVAKTSYLLGEPERGDVAALQNPEGTGGVLIKRVAGVSGDAVEIRDGVLYVNGEPEPEAYVNRRLNDGNYFGPEKVPAGEVFVMGDNRSNSRDSRIFGPVPEQYLSGKVLMRLWPPGRIGGM